MKRDWCLYEWELDWVERVRGQVTRTGSYWDTQFLWCLLGSSKVSMAYG